MDAEQNCLSCYKPLPPGAPKGLCPECLMKAGFPTGVAPEAGQPSKVPSFVPPTVEELGKLFPQFEILELLGQGGMGAVYKARQRTLERLVAIKILPPEAGADPGFADRFTREARALAKLSHPNIVAVHEFGQAGELHYFVMEYVEGLNLRKLEQAGKLSPREALQIIPQICDALQFAHEEGIVHRDIKPENVMLDRKGRVKITDFGLAKILGLEPDATRLTGAKDVMGTPHYMAPEQLERPQEVDHRADIYSLGVVFYEMLTGELPLGKFQPPSRKVQVDVRLDQVVLHALEKEPERRYQQANDVKSDVHTIASTSASTPKPAPAPLAVAPTPASAGSAKIAIPAVGLIVVGLLKVFGAVTTILLLGSSLLSSFLHTLGPIPFWLFDNPLFGWSLGLFKAIPGLLMIFGGLQMVQTRSYAWSIAAAILGIVTCSLLGIPIGIWALIVLAGAEVRQTFANEAATRRSRSGQWGWVSPAAGAVTLLLVVGLLVLAVVGGAKALSSLPAVQGGSGTNVFEALQDTADATLTTNQAVLAETPNPTAAPETNAPAQTGPIQRTVTAGSEANVSKSFIVGREGKLALDVDRGEVTVIGTEKDTVDIRATRRVRRANDSDANRILAEQKLVLKQMGNEVAVNAQTPPTLDGWRGWGWNRPELDVTYEISVPRRCDVHLKTAGGGIKVASVQGPVRARTEGGGLHFEALDGDVDGQTAGGGIYASECKGQLLIKTEGGGINVQTFSGPQLKALTEGGSISADLVASPKSDSVLHTSGGSITVRLPETAMLTLDAHTEGGSVTSDLPVESQDKTEQSAVRGKVNGGGPLLEVETLGGSIQIKKR
jgi:serine/threonine protein kinase